MKNKTSKKPLPTPEPTGKFSVKPRKPGTTKNHRLHMYGENKTKQSGRDSCDINLIMAKFVKTGVMDHQREHGAEYGFASSDTFNDSMQIVAKANSMFEELPSKIRSKFENSPGKFLDFVQDPKNLEEMQEMGLANKRLNEQTETPPLPNPPEAKPTEIVEKTGEKTDEET